MGVYVWLLVVFFFFFFEYFVSFLISQSPRLGRESWLLYFYWPLDVTWLFIGLYIFHTDPWIGLQCVIVAFHGYAQLLLTPCINVNKKIVYCL